MGLELLNKTESRIQAATLYLLAPLFGDLLGCDEAWESLCEQPKYCRLLMQAGLRHVKKGVSRAEVDPNGSFLKWCIARIKIESDGTTVIPWQDWRDWPIFQSSR